jgi:hypothetical protein
MSITREQYDALKPGDRLRVVASTHDRTVVGVLNGMAWVSDGTGVAYHTNIRDIDAIIPPAPQPVAWVNFYVTGPGPQVVGAAYGTRAKADEMGALYGRTHIALIHDDTTITTEAVS